jgi:integrase
LEEGERMMRGSIIKRGGTHSVVIELEPDPVTGKRRREWHSGYRTKREAEDARIAILGRIQRGEHVEPSRLTLSEFLTGRWLPARESSLRPSTFESYTRNVRVHVVPKLGSARLQGMAADELNSFYADRLRVLSPRTVRYLHSILHRALADALKWGLVVRNVADAADPPSQRATRPAPPKTWSAHELHAFINRVAGDRLYALWLLYATTGLRRGEALALRWSDLDLERGCAGISQAIVTAGYRVHHATPKTSRGRRSVALDPATVSALREHRKRQAAEQLALAPAYQDHRLVFCNEDGSRIHPDRISKLFSRHVEALGVARITLHGLRHTWASLTLQTGVNPKVVSERLGHATVSFTLDAYAHVMPGMQEDAAGRVARLVFGA